MEVRARSSQVWDAACIPRAPRTETLANAGGRDDGPKGGLRPPPSMDPEIALQRDLERLERAATALDALVAEIDLGAADAADLAPVVQLVEQFAFGFLLPCLREVVAPHLIASGALRSLPPRFGPGEDEELHEALRQVRDGLHAAGSSVPVVSGARMLARSLEARARLEHALLDDRSSAVGIPDAPQLEHRLREACPDLEDRRALADRLLQALEFADGWS